MQNEWARSALAQVKPINEKSVSDTDALTTKVGASVTHVALILVGALLTDMAMLADEHKSQR